MTGRYGTRLRAARIKAGLTQAEVERRTKGAIPKARLSRYENGWVIPTLPVVERLAKAYGISPADLLGW